MAPSRDETPVRAALLVPTSRPNLVHHLLLSDSLKLTSCPSHRVQLDEQEYEPSPAPESHTDQVATSGSDEDQSVPVPRSIPPTTSRRNGSSLLMHPFHIRRKHHNQVQGGIKAAIANPRVSDEKKDELKARLD